MWAESVRRALRKTWYETLKFLEVLASVARNVLNLHLFFEPDHRAASRHVYSIIVGTFLITGLLAKISEIIGEANEISESLSLAYLKLLALALYGAIPLWITNKLFPANPIGISVWINLLMLVYLSTMIWITLVLLILVVLGAAFIYIKGQGSSETSLNISIMQIGMFVLTIFVVVLPIAAYLRAEWRIQKFTLRTWIVHKLILSYSFIPTYVLYALLLSSGVLEFISTMLEPYFRRFDKILM